jgi:hypothetical protein
MHTYPLVRRHDDYPDIPGAPTFFHALKFPELLVGIVDLIIWAVVISAVLAG